MTSRASGCIIAGFVNLLPGPVRRILDEGFAAQGRSAGVHLVWETVPVGTPTERLLLVKLASTHFEADGLETECAGPGRAWAVPEAVLAEASYDQATSQDVVDARVEAALRRSDLQ